MNEHDATEQAYKNGYKQGLLQGVKDCTKEIERLKAIEKAHREQNGELREEIKRLEDILTTPDKSLTWVVRCKNCAFSEDHIIGGIWCNHPDNRNPLGCRPNDFCNDGKPKEADL